MNFHPKLSCHRPELTYEIIIQNGNEQVYEQVLERDKAQKKSFPFFNLAACFGFEIGGHGALAANLHLSSCYMLAKKWRLHDFSLSNTHIK